MKIGKTINEWAGEIKAIVENRKDYLVRAGSVRMEVDENEPILTLPCGQKSPVIQAKKIQEHVHHQVGQYLDIPAQYYGRMKAQAPELLAENVNTWLRQKGDDIRLIRTRGTDARGWLGRGYRPLDYEHFVEPLMQVVDHHRLQPRSMDITPIHMYFKATTDRLKAEVRPGMVVEGGLSFQASDVGLGAVSLGLFICELRCMNGAIAESILRQVHLGQRHRGDFEVAKEYHSDETRRLKDQAFFSEFRDSVKFLMTGEPFGEYVGKMRQAAGLKVDNPQRVVENLVDTTPELTKTDGDSILKYLIDSKEFDLLGLHSAVTRRAQDAELSYDKASELEKLGARMFDLSGSEWSVLNTKEPRKRKS